MTEFIEPILNITPDFGDNKKILIPCTLNIILVPGMIPNGVEHVRFNPNFNIAIEPGIFPDSVEKIEFGYNFNQILKPGSLPPNLQSIIFSSSYNQEIMQGVLPNNLKTIIFGTNFNTNIEPNTFPNSVQKIKFGCWFNKPLKSNVLPINLESIIFGDCFNKPIESNVLPINLKSIIFGENFCSKIASDALPPNLQIIKFNNRYSGYSIDKNIVIPLTITTFKYDVSLSNLSSISHVVDKITSLCIHTSIFQHNNWASTIKILKDVPKISLLDAQCCDLLVPLLFHENSKNTKYYLYSHINSVGNNFSIIKNDSDSEYASFYRIIFEDPDIIARENVELRLKLDSVERELKRYKKIHEMIKLII